MELGDTFLLCSDGLSNQVSNDEIGMVLGCLPPQEAAQALIDLACLRGGPDNITAVIVRVSGPQVARGDRQAAPAARAGRPASAGPAADLDRLRRGVAGDGGVGEYRAPVGGGGQFLCGAGRARGGPPATLRRRGFGRLGRRRFGRGPYVAADAAATFDLLARLTGVTQQLRDASAAEQWSVDWTEFDQRLARAQAALAAPTTWPRLPASSCRAISAIMAQLRRQPEAGSDSGVIRL